MNIDELKFIADHYSVVQHIKSDYISNPLPIQSIRGKHISIFYDKPILDIINDINTIKDQLIFSSRFNKFNYKVVELNSKAREDYNIFKLLNVI